MYSGWLELRAARALLRAGVLAIESPARLQVVAQTMSEYGPVGAAPRIAALRHGPRTAIVDDGGELSFDQLNEAVNRLANTLRDRGFGPGDVLGILCRNHRWPLIAAFAASRAGMTAVWLNTGFSVRQAADVAAREGVDLLVFDADLADIAAAIAAPRGRFACAVDDPAANEIAGLSATASPLMPPPPTRPGRLVQLTSGTTGLPKGAPRPDPRSLTIPGGLLERLPMRSREATVVAPPLFHGTGLVIALLSISLGSTLILRRRFDAAGVLADIERYRATTVCLVPIMLSRIVAQGDEAVGAHDLSALRIVFCAGSRLPAQVSGTATRLLGDVVYNLYGSTEVSISTLATPSDLRAAPTTVGKPALGARVRILDEQGRVAPTGVTGRIFVASTAPFEGYTGGGGKEIIDGMLATGDLGHFDAANRLFIDGRDDEMVISGGENIFPGEVEELLVTHPGIAEAAVIGVADEEFGQRLRAFVVGIPGQEIDADTVRDFVKNQLARYKSPRDVIFVTELPRNPMGKVLKRELTTLTGDAEHRA
ncbi:AMP-binding protein [Nocardia sp. NBC_01388]|uniref:AMP-binding protein n=1 Tax=Nocardia sp. NBC_01388 TaxID=2903596 RepID=UPI003244BCEA